MAALGILAVQSTTAAADDRPTIPVIVKDTTSFYWQIVLAGARAAGKEYNVNVPELGAQSEGDIAGQISILENAVAGQPAAIVISPTQFKALGKPIDQAAKTTKVIGIDGSADTKSLTSFLGTDNIAGGAAAADALAEGVKAKTGKVEGDVAVLTNIAGQDSGDRRVKGFIDQVKAKYSGLNIVANKIADGQATTALNNTTDLITAYPKLVGVFANALVMGQGAGQALAENKAQDKITLVSFDSDDKTVKMLADGVIYAMAVQNPFREGHDAVKIALDASQGKDVPATVDTGVTIITKANMDSDASKALLSPKVN
ncbi:substrate-binding domain-containing protein [Mesorhizobium sp. B3-1-6]|uniref:substrate-binding domain-containing protein n=1 Tax=Mesorhizobium sp. B3-1-6 TaxID=2589895 RepID=UPI001FF03A00|nr:substrate-binding domain-containing protein [Mesorhizobium sp. B3-1-6]